MSPEEPQDWESPPRRVGRWEAITVVGLVLVGGIAAFLIVSPHPRPTPQPAAVATASASAVRKPPCNATELTLIGAFNSCAHQVSDRATLCSISGQNLSTVTVLSDGGRRYLLYLDGGGAYQGPGAYPLHPWQDVPFGVGKGSVKVALREYISGDFWVSESGSLEVTPGARGGGVLAGLVSTTPETRRSLKLQGAWSC